MRKIVTLAAGLAAGLAIALAGPASASVPAAVPRVAGICGALPVYRANGHESMAAWARAHHAHISTIILSTMAYCTKSGRLVVLRIVRQMGHYVDLGDQQHKIMPRGMIFTSPPQAQAKALSVAGQPAA